ncbi:RNA polymerase sigma factor [Micromonospora sp. NPDC051543]|uniref:RNA polymerase sigma factor n=1 Tax=Micromonospora sp. NPDC051543 TaxID=3364287 RepID=UPI003790EFA4
MEPVIQQAAPTGASAAQQAVDTFWRHESAKLVAALMRVVGDLGTAEEIAHDALVNALEQWPTSGVPANPGAWLTTAAKRRAFDLLRRQERYQRKLEQLSHESRAAGTVETPDFEAVLDADFGDDVLRLIFTACHPLLPTPSQVALTLRVVGGLRTDEIARAYLVTESTVSQRIVRAKRQLAKAQVPFEVPQGPERNARLSSVLQVIYLVFNEGYAATAGDDWLRPTLCTEAVRLARILAELMPLEPEVHGLLALLEIQSSRLPARTGPDGQPVLLLEQDRSLWNQVLIGHGLAALDRAQRLTGTPGPYQLQAAIAACHARAHRAQETDWARIAALFEQLSLVAPSPVVELNRAVALSMALGPSVGLALVDALRQEPALQGYHLLPSVRGDLLVKLGRLAEAGAEFTRAASLTGNGRERTLLRGRAESCARGLPPAR